MEKSPVGRAPQAQNTFFSCSLHHANVTNVRTSSRCSSFVDLNGAASPHGVITISTMHIDQNIQTYSAHRHRASPTLVGATKLLPVALVLYLPPVALYLGEPLVAHLAHLVLFHVLARVAECCDARLGAAGALRQL